MDGNLSSYSHIDIGGGRLKSTYLHKGIPSPLISKYVHTPLGGDLGRIGRMGRFPHGGETSKHK